ncbi:MAG TPA: serine protease [Planctomycetaceae bacterium]|nr:serine protease [Planctomycetaceae bacterium]
MSESLAGRHYVRSFRLSCCGSLSCLSASLVILSCCSVATDAIAQAATPPYQSRRIGDPPWPPSSNAPPLRQANGESVGDAQPIPIESTNRQSSDLSADSRRSELYDQVDADFEYVDRLGGLVKRVARLVKPSVIHIEARKVEKKQGRSEAYDEAGAGVVVEIAGSSWILTNRHVIAGAELSEIAIRTDDGRKLRPSKVIADASTDVAVMKVEGVLPLARIGRSNSVDIGDFVIAIGSPFGLSHSVTFGILSARGRRDLTLGSERIELQDFFQTDAAINPGNSGGPLLNMRGEVVAINTAIASNGGGSEGIGFAIPIDMVMRVAEELVRHGKLRRGYLGVTLDPDFQTADSLRTTGSPFGALVKDVRAGSPAHEARLQRGDVILEFDGASIENDDHLVTLAGLTMINREVPVVIYRAGKKYRTTMKIAPLN